MRKARELIIKGEDGLNDLNKEARKEETVDVRRFSCASSGGPLLSQKD